MSKWYGITVTSRHVTQIKLRNNQLAGELPTELCQLQHLQQLDFGGYGLGNQLIGEIPPQLGQLSQLITLDLRDNPLEGTLPKTLCELTHFRESVPWC